MELALRTHLARRRISPCGDTVPVQAECQTAAALMQRCRRKGAIISNRAGAPASRLTREGSAAVIQLRASVKSAGRWMAPRAGTCGRRVFSFPSISRHFSKVLGFDDRAPYKSTSQRALASSRRRSVGAATTLIGSSRQLPHQARERPPRAAELPRGGDDERASDPPRPFSRSRVSSGDGATRLSCDDRTRDRSV